MERKHKQSSDIHHRETSRHATLNGLVPGHRDGACVILMCESDLTGCSVNCFFERFCVGGRLAILDTMLSIITPLVWGCAMAMRHAEYCFNI